MSDLLKMYDLPREKKVRKANELIQKSRFDLSLQQQKIVLYLISQITPFDEEFKTYEFDIAEFCKVCGLDYTSGKNYEDLKEHIKKIADKSMWLTSADGSRETLVRWIEKPRIYHNSGTIELRLDEDLKPYLLQLKANYTEYELVYTLNFKSKYTIRLYELIKSIHFNELEDYERTFELEELAMLLGAEKYKTYQHLKDRVLIPSINEINKTSDKIIEFEPIRKKRSIIGIKICIKTKDIAERTQIREDIENKYTLIAKQYKFFDE